MKETLKEIIDQRKYEFLGILLIVLAILNTINLLSKETGVVGDSIALGLRFVIGNGIYMVPGTLLLWGIAMIRTGK